MSAILKKAVEIMTSAHLGQFRKDGKEYITHPIEVARIVAIYNSQLNTTLNRSDLIEDLQIVALGHDLEDCTLKEEEYISQLKSVGLPDARSEQILIALKILNKFNHKSYYEYILAAKRNRMATDVKIADLTHNLSDLKPGHQRDKYELAKHILMS